MLRATAALPGTRHIESGVLVTEVADRLRGGVRKCTAVPVIPDRGLARSGLPRRLILGQSGAVTSGVMPVAAPPSTTNSLPVE